MTEYWTAEARGDLEHLIELALAEDRVDLDRATIGVLAEASARVRGRITAVEDGVFCGGFAGRRVFERLDPAALVEHVEEGTICSAGDEVFSVVASAAVVLGGERTALNFMSHLSGIASTVRRWQADAGSVSILDTRKTLPGWRRLQKLAVRAGGGTNHRADLAEFPMLKENHRDLFRKAFLDPRATAEEEIGAMLTRLRDSGWSGAVQVEVEDFDSFVACLQHGVDFILIDNQAPSEIRAWLDRVESSFPELGDRSTFGDRLEASGGIDDRTLSEYAASGVGRISLGALTHSVRAFDLSLHVEWE